MQSSNGSTLLVNHSMAVREIYLFTSFLTRRKLYFSKAHFDGLDLQENEKMITNVIEDAQGASCNRITTAHKRGKTS